MTKRMRFENVDQHERTRTSTKGDLFSCLCEDGDQHEEEEEKGGNVPNVTGRPNFGSLLSLHT